jgi:NADH-quinone oxidoreductase subunit M
VNSRAADLACLLDWTLLLPLLGALVLAVFFQGRAKATAWAACAITGLCACFIFVLAYHRHGLSQVVANQHLFLKTKLLRLDFAFAFSDGLSSSLALLTGLLMPISVLCSMKAIRKNVTLFYCSLLILEAGMLGTFLATDLLAFYISWESVLIPMTLLIGIWGSHNRLYASVKLFLYTMFGSLPLLAALLAISWTGERFITDLKSLSLHLAGHPAPTWAFWALALAFAIKLPLIPLHTWLPDAHTEAPTAGSVILAGVMLKMGTYGFLRLAFPFFPQFLETALPLLGWLACAGILYGSLMALAQTDIKRLIAYSSVAHLGTCMLGIFTLNALGLMGGQLQMLNHGISTGLLFLIFGMLYERGHVRDIAAYGGLARKMPLLTTAFFIATLSSIGLPLTNGFIGEFYVLMGAFQHKALWGILASFGVVLGAVYMLRLFRLVFLGEYKVPPGSEEHMKDLSLREVLLLLPLFLLVFVIGLHPQWITDLLPESRNALLSLKGF